MLRKKLILLVGHKVYILGLLSDILGILPQASHNCVLESWPSHPGRSVKTKPSLCANLRFESVVGPL